MSIKEKDDDHRERVAIEKKLTLKEKAIIKV